MVGVKRNAVSVASDRRGRVPFSVIGVLLLVSSLALAPTLLSDPAPSETAVERAMTEMGAASQTAVRDSVATAGHQAAADPVVEPADTDVGNALNDSQPFRDALRLRVYLQVRDRLDRLSARSDGVEATASLPAVNTTSDYERAIDRVALEEAGENDTAVEATVENITLSAHRGDRLLTRRNVSHTVVVSTPVLMLHEQMQTYETRLNNSLTKPGLSQRLTARLYPIAWARGYAQYGGVPIANVIANRHVSLATNGALLGVQRSVFGRSDSEGRQALTEATAVVGIEDVITGSNDTALASKVLDRGSYQPATQNISTGGGGSDTPKPNESMRVGINGTADTAFYTVAAPSALNETAKSVYSADVRVATERDHLSGGRPDRPDPPGSNWSFHRETTTSTATVVENVSGEPTVPSGWHTLERFGRTVEVTHKRTVYWTKKRSPQQSTTATETETVRVRAALIGRHSNESLAPSRGISNVHNSSGSPLDGENMAGIESSGETELLGDSGHDGIAKRIARETFEQETVTVTGERPESLYTWLYNDLRELRKEVREINTTVERESVGSFETNPARQLSQRLEQRREKLVSVPETYDSVAHRARIAARIEFIDTVNDRLTNDTQQLSDVQSNVSSELGDQTDGSLTALRRGLTARKTKVPRSSPVPTGPAGPVRTRVDAQPQYLTLGSVDESDFPAVNGSETPLVARNVNVFSVPYGNAVNVVLNGATGSSNRVGLGTAAKTLAAANETEPSETNATLTDQRAALQGSVATANENVESALSDRVAAETDADSDESGDIVDAGLTQWETTAARGMALANASAAGTIATEAAEEQNLSTVEEDWLRIRLKRETTTTLATADAKLEPSVVNETASTVRSIARQEIQSALTDKAKQGVKDVAERRLGTRALPAGLPLAPPLTAWYATMNIWWVTVKGEYGRFAVEASHGTPVAPGGTTTYAREDEQVTFDVDGDGESETVGSNTRLSFTVDTGVVVVVPPQPRGVGDKDGNSVETSSGWPNPG